MITEREFNNIYASHAHKVFRLCLGYASGNEDLAKEWQQETFIKVWKHKGSFKKKSSISTWIYRIAINTCLGDLRKSKKSSLDLVHIHGIMHGHRKAKLSVRVGRKTTGLAGEDPKAAEI